MALSVSSSYSKLRSLVESSSNDALPAPSSILKAESTLPTSLPSTGLGEEATEEHLLTDIVPGFNGPKTSAQLLRFRDWWGLPNR